MRRPVVSARVAIRVAASAAPSATTSAAMWPASESRARESASRPTASTTTKNVLTSPKATASRHRWRAPACPCPAPMSVGSVVAGCEATGGLEQPLGFVEQGPDPGGVGERVVGGAPDRAVVDQAAVAQAGEVLGDRRLGQAEVGHQVDDAVLAQEEVFEDGQPRRLGGAWNSATVSGGLGSTDPSVTTAFIVMRR